MTRSADEAYWRDLESNAHEPDVQELIREEIQNGTIRVRPNGEGGIRIVPIGMPESEESIEREVPPAGSPDETSQSSKVPLRRHIARR